MHAPQRRPTTVWFVVGGITAGTAGTVVGAGPYALLAATVAAGAAGALTLLERQRAGRRLPAARPAGTSDALLRRAPLPPQDEQLFARVVVPPLDGYPAGLPHGALPRQRRASSGS